MRISSRSLSVLDLQGIEVKKVSLRSGRVVDDLGDVLLIEDDRRNIHCFNDDGEKMFVIKGTGIGVTSCSYENGKIAICEGRSHTKILDRNGELIKQILTPEGFNPVTVNFGSEKKLHLVSIKPGNSYQTELSVYSPYATLLHQELIPSCPTSLIFSDTLTGWIGHNLVTFAFEDGNIKRGELEVIRQAFNLERPQ